MKTMFIMVGLPGVGKSYNANKLANKYNGFIFSSDQYREMMFGNVNDQTHNSQLFKKFKEDIEYHCSVTDNDDCIIIDSTNTRMKDRKYYIDTAKRYGYESVIVFVNKFLTDIFKQNKERDRVVPEEVIKRMYKNFEYPSLVEGYDSIEMI